MSDQNTNEKIAAVQVLTSTLLHNSIALIDDALGEGYAKKNPHLTAEVLSTQQSLYDSAPSSR